MPLRRLLVLAFLLLGAGPALADALVQTPLTIPASFPDGSHASLEALLLRPSGPGPFPVAILSHGTPRDAAERANMTPLRHVPEAREFARRGWATLIVMRRGYAGSSGPFSEHSGPCDNRDYLKSGHISAEDVRQAVAYMAGQRFADPSRIIAVGVSAGGYASVALSANPPPGLQAVISFAGGRGSQAENDVCQEDRLVAAFGTFGRTSRVPQLWIYAENDLFFGPDLARRFHQAFTRNGGRAELVMEPPSGKDGHGFFGAAIPQWTPLVDRFLAQNGLTVRSTPIALPVSALEPPAELSASGRAKFAAYAEAPDNKAFAVASDGAYAWKSGLRSLDMAQQQAVEACATHTTRPCHVAIVNDRPVNGAVGSAVPSPPAGSVTSASSTVPRRLEPPAQLSAANRAKFGAYVDAPGNKAFAVAPDGAFGWKSGMASTQDAQRGALDNCNKYASQGCRVVIINDRMLP
ncbi:CocE/NonD family hydrolase [Azospirillum sp. TSO35-2]|uniref:alpha/beta hydrolase family protein n=1 Tax=Azospirillum sp. TSO35-2 TaxID=716796 RepID=UPI000D616BEF|nr:CocE/NonD family hydrolase [Azospirillum sp. TSO35-2]PWC34192.1 dienelactone hydrolase [Azospirillum sp. TSO35-2]